MTPTRNSENIQPHSVTVHDLIGALPNAQCTGPTSTILQNLTYDSRRVTPGALFVAIAGENADGNDYIFGPGGALERGAVAILSERPPPCPGSFCWIQVDQARQALAIASRAFFGDTSSQLELVGITGTKGKTTTCYLVDSIFRQTGEPCCMLGTVAYRIGTSSRPAERTTPEASDIQSLLQAALREGCPRAVMEVSSHSLSLHRVYGLSFHTACFTNLSRDHLDYHGDFESYFRSKSRLFFGGEVRGPQKAVINVDDPWGQRLSSLVRGETLTFGMASSAAIYPEQWFSSNAEPIRMRVRTPRGKIDIHSPLRGQGNKYNLLAALAVGQSLGLTDEHIYEGIQKVDHIPGRMEFIDCGQPFSVIVDYAHSEAALENLLLLARGLQPRRLITLFGCGGDRDRGKRPLMGKVAAAHSDRIIVTNDNPRNENPESIAEEIEAGLLAGGAQWVRCLDRYEAIRQAIGMAESGDVVLIAGKGHETYQEFSGAKVHFDDQEVVREVLLQQRPGNEKK